MASVLLAAYERKHSNENGRTMLLLDSDIMIDVLRHHQPALDWLAQQGGEEIILPGFVVLELFQGCRDKAEQTRLERRVAQARIVGSSGIAVITVNLRLFLLWSPGRLSIRTQRPNHHVCFPTAIPKDPDCTARRVSLCCCTSNVCTISSQSYARLHRCFDRAYGS